MALKIPNTLTREKDVIAPSDPNHVRLHDAGPTTDDLANSGNTPGAEAMDLKITNTLTREKEVFRPIDPNHVRLYVCGPTVYDFAHVGNARPVVVFDVLARLLRRLYPRVTYVRNITDVDDKINARARDNGETIAELTARTAAQFHADMAALGALPPDVEPRATHHIAQMIDRKSTRLNSSH